MKVDAMCPNNACETVELHMYGRGRHFRHMQLVPEDEPLCVSCGVELVNRRRVPDTHRFPLGLVVATKAVTDLTDSPTIQRFLTRHVVGDWGHITPERWSENEKNITMQPPNRGRVVSLYKVQKQDILVLTEGGGHETTVLTLEEY